jgi:hypothetical protein
MEPAAMSDPFLIASIALGLSVLASAVRMVDWFLHSDPRVLAKTMRWVLIALALLSVPLLIWLLVKEQWVAATGLLAVMVLLPSFLGRGSLMQRFGLYRRPVLDDSPPYRGDGEFGFSGAGTPDPDLVRRSAAVLEVYLGRRAGAEAGSGLALTAVPRLAGKEGEDSSGSAEGFGAEPMSAGEALEILGLDPGARDWEISAAHRRLLQKLHPESGGSSYLAIKVDQARDVLLRSGARQLRQLTTELPRKPSPRREQS